MQEEWVHSLAWRVGAETLARARDAVHRKAGAWLVPDVWTDSACMYAVEHMGVCSMWSVQYAECAACGVCGMWSVQHVECAACGVCSMWSVQHEECAA